MAARKSTKPRSNGSAILAEPEFKYRSISDIEKKRVHEVARGNLETEHYRMQVEIDVLAVQPLGSEENAEEQREQYVERIREQMGILESMIRTHNEKIADIDSGLVAAAQEED